MSYNSETSSSANSCLTALFSLLQRTFGLPATLTSRRSAAGPERLGRVLSGSSRPTGPLPSTEDRRLTTQVGDVYPPLRWRVFSNQQHSTDALEELSVALHVTMQLLKAGLNLFC